MQHSTRLFLVALTVILMAGSGQAQEPIRFARTPDISPDGKLICFSYLGDIFTCETIGGTARAITSHPAHDINPVFSPDGREVAFSSNRHGSYDVFVVSARGGKPRRLTFDSANDMVCAWSPDGKNILFASSRGATFPPSYELYSVPATGGRSRLLTPGEGKEGAYSPKGDLLAYVRGPGDWYRKGYRGSSNDDVWVCNADGSNNRRLTTFNGQDHSPMWSPDAATIYYVSEQPGTANVVKVPIASLGDPTKAARPVPLTTHTEDSVRRARISQNGEWIVYECGADLWVVGTTTENARPRKLAIEVNADDKSNNEQVVTRTSGATEFALSADEKFVVFAVHGKLFRMPVGPNSRPTQLTTGSSNDHGAAWSPDGSKIIYISDKKGHDDLYLLEADDPDHPKFTEAHRFKEKQLTDTQEPESAVSFSPDGKRVAFIRGGKLMTMAPDGKDIKTLVAQTQVFDYEWSPDSRWVVYARRDGSFANELYIVPATGATAAEPARNITRYATANMGVTWSADGKRLAFLGDRRGATLHYLDLEKPEDKTDSGASRPSFGLTWNWGSKSPLTIDWDDIHLRVKPVNRAPADEAAISPDGSRIAYRDAGNNDLWVTSISGGNITRITTGGVSPHNMVWSKRRGLPSGIELLYYLDGNGQMRLCNVGSSDIKPGSDRSLLMPFRVKMTIRQDDLYTEMFDQSWRHISENFYDEKFHGRNWADVRKAYRPLVKHISMKEDLYALLYLMMGELNASHLGVSGFGRAPEEETAELGLLYDSSYRGKGLKISEILKRGPADRKGLTLKSGEYILSIDGTELDDSANVSKLLNGKVGEPVVLQVTDNPTDPKSKKRRVEITGMSRFSRATPGMSELMYDRWVARNAARVAEKSGGKLGYIHIPSMDEEGLDRFVRSLYSDNYDKEAIVLDVRFNGGGYTHDRVLNYLGSREHTVFKNRDGGTGVVMRAWDRKWTKPLTLLINNRSYSDAEIFPSAFKTLGLGKLVGEPTAGFVIGTGGVRLIDGSLFRIPRIGVYTTRGVNMDKEGVAPDVTVENHPDQLARGVDAQLDRAVEVLQSDVVAWKKKKQPEVTVLTPAVPTKGESRPGTGTGSESATPAPGKAPTSPTPMGPIKP